MEAGYYRKSQEHLNRNDYFGSRNDIATNFAGRSNFDMDQVVLPVFFFTFIKLSANVKLFNFFFIFLRVLIAGVYRHIPIIIHL